MIKNIVLLFLFYIACFLLSPSFAITTSGNGMPVKYISSCEIDLNNDNRPDVALLIETIMGRELIVLMRNEDGYESYLLATGDQNMYMSCHFGNEVEETIAGKGEKETKVHKTNGTYLQVVYLESSSVVFFWKDNMFKKIWTSD